MLINRQCSQHSQHMLQTCGLYQFILRLANFLPVKTDIPFHWWGNKIKVWYKQEVKVTRTSTESSLLCLYSSFCGQIWLSIISTILPGIQRAHYQTFSTPAYREQWTVSVIVLLLLLLLYSLCLLNRKFRSANCLFLSKQ